MNGKRIEQRSVAVWWVLLAFALIGLSTTLAVVGYFFVKLFM